MLKKFNGHEIPLCVKVILEHAAYNNCGALLELNEEKVLEIENYINETDRSVIESLSCCHSDTYKRQNRFTFLPGHKCLILTIPKDINSMNESKKKNSSRLMDFKKLLTPAELKDLLLARLNQNLSKYIDGVSGCKSFSAANLGEVQTIITNNMLTAKCKVSCVECTSVVQHIRGLGS